MPNTPSSVHEGMAGISAGAHATDEHMAQAEEVLGHVGRTVRVAEAYMDAVTAVSGSGPAYFALLAESMIEAGILLGLSREISTQLVVQTMLGTAKLLRDGGMHPVELREMVTSPGRDDDRRDPRARAGGRPRRVPERDPGRDEALEGAGGAARRRAPGSRSAADPQLEVQVRPGGAPGRADAADPPAAANALADATRRRGRGARTTCTTRVSA